ncbi:MAG: hypothetical protein LBC74_07745 [Planctomycetaceae bacterium]|jgi:hypothetical protein|nr:hypothetical protein [Planctomycetaceae bacterium]
MKIEKSILLTVWIIFCLVCLLASVDIISAADNIAVDIIKKCDANLIVTNHIQYNFKSETTTVLPTVEHKRVKQGVVCRDGGKIDIRNELSIYENNKIIDKYPEENIVADNYAIYNHIYPTKSPNRITVIAADKKKSEISPLGTSGTGYALDGNIEDTMRFTDIMLSEPDKIEKIGEEAIDGFSCAKIKSATKYGLIVAWIDINNGYVARKVTCFRDANTVNENGEKYIVQPDVVTSFLFTNENSDFVKIGSNYIAIKGTCTVERNDSDKTTTKMVTRCERDKIVLSPDFTGKNLFNAAHLKDELVNNHDDRKSGVLYVWDGEKSIPYVEEIRGEVVLPQSQGIGRLVTLIVAICVLLLAIGILIRLKLKQI